MNLAKLVAATRTGKLAEREEAADTIAHEERFGGGVARKEGFSSEPRRRGKFTRGRPDPAK